jgi:DNA-binding CsgD family transcriptional regulator
MSLTPREAEVARLVGRGLTCKKVAKELGISTSTASVHVQNAAAKIDGPGSPKHRLIVWALTEDPHRTR